MIDQGVFKNEWAVLCERFGKYEGSRVISKRYYDHLAPLMTTEQFVAAARRLFASAEFFPRPDAFLEAVGLAGESAAGADWEHANAVMYGDAAAYARLSEEGRRVVGLMGGVRGLQSTHEDRSHWRRREFMDLYGQAPPDPPAHELTAEGRELLGDAMSGALAGRIGGESG